MADAVADLVEVVEPRCARAGLRSGGAVRRSGRGGAFRSIGALRGLLALFLLEPLPLDAVAVAVLLAELVVGDAATVGVVPVDQLLAGVLPPAAELGQLAAGEQLSLARAVVAVLVLAVEEVAVRGVDGLLVAGLVPVGELRTDHVFPGAAHPGNVGATEAEGLVDGLGPALGLLGVGRRGVRKDAANTLVGVAVAAVHLLHEALLVVVAEVVAPRSDQGVVVEAGEIVRQGRPLRLGLRPGGGALLLEVVADGVEGSLQVAAFPVAPLGDGARAPRPVPVEGLPVAAGYLLEAAGKGAGLLGVVRGEGQAGQVGAVPGLREVPQGGAVFLRLGPCHQATARGQRQAVPVGCLGEGCAALRGVLGGGESVAVLPGVPQGVDVAVPCGRAAARGSTVPTVAFTAIAAGVRRVEVGEVQVRQSGPAGSARATVAVSAVTAATPTSTTALPVVVLLLRVRPVLLVVTVVRGVVGAASVVLVVGGRVGCTGAASGGAAVQVGGVAVCVPVPTLSASLVVVLVLLGVPVRSGGGVVVVLAAVVVVAAAVVLVFASRDAGGLSEQVRGALPVRASQVVHLGEVVEPVSGRAQLGVRVVGVFGPPQGIPDLVDLGQLVTARPVGGLVDEAGHAVGTVLGAAAVAV